MVAPPQMAPVPPPADLNPPSSPTDTGLEALVGNKTATECSNLDPLLVAPPQIIRPIPALPKQNSSWASVLTDKDDTDQLKPENVKVIDGIVHSTIPKEILKDQNPLWSKYIVGHFIGEISPHIGKVHATVNRLWTTQDKKSKVDAQFLSPKTVLFRIKDEKMRQRVLRRHFWHVSDIPMIVQEWTPATARSSPDLSSIPLWVDFNEVPDTLFSRKGLMFLGNLVGNAQKLHPVTERCTRFDVARVLVEVNLNNELPNMINLKGEPDISISIVYPWLPSRCSNCGN